MRGFAKWLKSLRLHYHKVAIRSRSTFDQKRKIESCSGIIKPSPTMIALEDGQNAEILPPTSNYYEYTPNFDQATRQMKVNTITE